MIGMVTSSTMSKLGSGSPDDYIVLGILAPLVILMFLIK
jgi:hypothetical protein